MPIGGSRFFHQGEPRRGPKTLEGANCQCQALPKLKVLSIGPSSTPNGIDPQGRRPWGTGGTVSPKKIWGGGTANALVPPIFKKVVLSDARESTNRVKKMVLSRKKGSYTEFNTVKSRKIWKTWSMTKKRSSEIFGVKNWHFFRKKSHLDPRNVFPFPQTRRQVSATVDQIHLRALSRQFLVFDGRRAATADNLSARRRWYTSAFRLIIFYIFMFFMISLKASQCEIEIDIISPTIRVIIRVTKFGFL